MKLVYYLPEGNYVKEKALELGDIMRCGTPSQTDFALGIGSNIEVSCDFNFDNLVAQIGGKTYQSYVYQLLILGQNGNYYEVNTYIDGSSQAVKRFFLEDTYTSSTELTVMTSMTFEVTLDSDSALVSPSLYVSYTQLSL